MSTEVMTTGRMVKGQLQLRHHERFKAEVSRLRDGEVVAIVRRAYATRSEAQNAYYWSVVVEELSKHIKGMNPDEVHELLKAKFLPKKGAAIDGNGRIVAEFVIGGSTTKLNRVEFGEYMERICQWAAEEPLCLPIPLPDPNWKQHDVGAPHVRCARCKQMVPPASIVVREIPWEDGGQSGTEEIEVCQTCAKGLAA